MVVAIADSAPETTLQGLISTVFHAGARRLTGSLRTEDRLKSGDSLDPGFRCRRVDE